MEKAIVNDDLISFRKLEVTSYPRFHGDSIFLFAVMKRATKILTWMLTEKRNAFARYFDELDIYGHPPIYYANSPDIFKLLVENGVQIVNIKSNFNIFDQLASREGNAKNLKYLVNRIKYKAKIANGNNEELKAFVFHTFIHKMPDSIEILGEPPNYSTPRLDFIESFSRKNSELDIVRDITPKSFEEDIVRDMTPLEFRYTLQFLLSDKGDENVLKFFLTHKSKSCYSTQFKEIAHELLVNDIDYYPQSYFIRKNLIFEQYRDFTEYMNV